MHAHAPTVSIATRPPSPPAITPRADRCEHCDGGRYSALDLAASIAADRPVDRVLRCDECGGSGYDPMLRCELGCQVDAADAEGDARWFTLDGEPVCGDCLRDALEGGVRAGYCPADTDIDRVVDDALEAWERAAQRGEVTR